MGYPRLLRVSRTRILQPYSFRTTRTEICPARRVERLPDPCRSVFMDVHIETAAIVPLRRLEDLTFTCQLQGVLE